MSSILELLKKIPLSKAGPAAGILVGLVAVFAIGWRMRWWQSLARTLGPLFWIALLLIVVVGVIVALLWLLPRFREKRFLDGLQSEDEQTPQAEVKESYRKLQQRMLETLRTLHNAPELRKKEGIPLYALPWFLLLGDGQSGKTTLLQGIADRFLPFAHSSSTTEDVTQDCEWWFFNTAIVLDTPGSYAFPAAVEREGAQWYRFLQLLRHYRHLQPINGVVITVAADALLLNTNDQVRHQAAELRKRIDEAIRQLGIDFPVYLLITRCDLIEGFTEFCNCLPEHTFQQVFGYAHEWSLADGQTSHPTATFQLEAVFSRLLARLRQIRLTIFNAEHPPPVERHQQLFCFPEEFQALYQPLNTFVDTFLFAHPALHQPRFRGLFFSSAQQTGTPTSSLRREFHLDGQRKALTTGTKTYFLHDLFATILPRDRYLARPTGRATRGRLFRHLFGLLGCVGLCLVLLLLLTRAFFDDRRAYAVVDQKRCAATTAAIPHEPRLEGVDRCRREIDTLSNRNQSRLPWSKVVFKRSLKLEKQLRQRYVEKFQAEVLQPLDDVLSRQLTTGAETIPLVFLLIDRIDTIKQCLSPVGCPHMPTSDRQLDYTLMLDPTQQHPPAVEQVAQLRQTYAAYLHSAATTPEVLQRERDAHAERLRQWFAAKQFAPQQVLLWANGTYPSITHAAYWQTDAGRQNNKGQVPGGYTQQAWRRSIAPFLQRAQDVVPNMAPELDTFREAYRAQYFAQWRRFLEFFPRGETLWGARPEQQRKLAMTLLTTASPYYRIIDVALENLQPFLPPPPQAEPPTTGTAIKPAIAGALTKPIREEAGIQIPPWIRLLQRFVESESRQAILASMEQTGERLAEGAITEESFRLAAEGFREGKPTAKSTHLLLKSWWIVEHFREEESTGIDEDVFWPLLERPIRFVWSAILSEAAIYLQERWTEDVMAPSGDLSELERLVFLYGPQGRVRMFVEELAKPFLTEDEKRLGQILGLKVPLSSEFLETLRDANEIGTFLTVGQSAPQRVRVEASGASFINGQTNMSEEKTEFLLECANKTYQVSNHPQEIAGSATTIFWSFDTCGDVVIMIFMSCNRLCVERAAAVGLAVPEISMLRLRKLYRGQAGFLHFIQDFSSGMHEFRLGDFADSYPQTEWEKQRAILRPYGIAAIRVMYRVDVPPTLSKLVSLMPGSMVANEIVK